MPRATDETQPRSSPYGRVVKKEVYVEIGAWPSDEEPSRSSSPSPSPSPTPARVRETKLKTTARRTAPWKNTPPPSNGGDDVKPTTVATQNKSLGSPRKLKQTARRGGRPSALASRPGGAVAPVTPTSAGRQSTDAKGTTPKAEPADHANGGDDSPATSRGGYNRALLVTLVVKESKADWAKLAYAVNKSATQCRDTWRKTVYPALLDGRAWSAGGPGWDVAMKLHLAREVLGTARPAWDAVALSFPGRTAAQVHDVWRKVVLPRLMQGKALY